ncbi:thiamine diphosphokinase [Paenibacillus eucommiae]|uniref:Thiamine diphosphokinase n=1 Tax=Paenibacillus eucommiae TaxID=1355755 RepID=A0ABS4J5C1_9BACL|nr:thiamine diphosphokinase [Paenibacillus eucommiae]MBP1995032.1 thiamine pyrophosphokinase [Paenibacillus eucommiae]
MNGKRIVIVTGGTLGPWVMDEIRQGDLLVGSDRGALFLLQNGFVPDISLGDFDSVTEAELADIRAGSKAFLECDPIDKDLTDTEMAFNWAMEQQPAEITLLGALGTRFDHSLANIHLLRKGMELGIPCKIIDANNEVILINSPTTIHKGRYTHVSLLPLSMEVTGITLNGFLYPLFQATLVVGQSLGISNVLLEQQGHIELASGYLLVIQSKDT